MKIAKEKKASENKGVNIRRFMTDSIDRLLAALFGFVGGNLL
jgi:hypothetical protein